MRNRARFHAREFLDGWISKQPDRFLRQPRRAPADPSSVQSGSVADSTPSRHHHRRSFPPVPPARVLRLHRAFVPTPRHTPVEFPFHSGPRVNAHRERSRAHKRGSAAIAQSKRHPDELAAPPRAAQSAIRTPSIARLAASADTKIQEKTAPPLLPASAE